MLRSAAASNGQQVRKRGEHGRPEPETALPRRGRRFYLLTPSPLRIGGFAYLRPSYAYVFRGNKIITIDKDWDGKEPVKIEVEVTDRMEIPTDKYPLKPGIT